MKKAQAALEYLFTYGWAFFGILIVISALFYFGIFDFSSLQPEKCEFPNEIYCKDYIVFKGTGNYGINLSVVNNFGFDVNISNINFTSDSGFACNSIFANGTQLYPTPADFRWPDGEKISIYGTDCNNKEKVLNKKTGVNVRIDFYDPRSGKSYMHTIRGYVFSKVQ